MHRLNIVVGTPPAAPGLYVSIPGWITLHGCFTVEGNEGSTSQASNPVSTDLWRVPGRPPASSG
ncbi:hypothetical protein GCM10023096_11520 [Nonomuraea ferruginea]